MTDRLRIVVGADDAGVDYKEALAAQLRQDERVAEVIDVGVGPDEHTAYPDVAVEASRKVAAGEADRALLICGTGLGMAITANKTPGVRAVTAHDVYSVSRSVLSNDAQVLTMGQRVIGLELARTLVDGWLDLRFDQTSPSSSKVELIRRYDEARTAAPTPDTVRAAESPVTRTVVVGSRSGLHARPARLFADAAKATGLRVLVSRAGGTPAPASSVLAVMAIGAQQGDEIVLSVAGPGAERVADDLAALVARDLDEE